MGIAILLLGLLPLAFMPDLLGSDSEGEDDHSGNQDTGSGSGDLLDDTSDNPDDSSDGVPDILTPIDEDDTDDDDPVDPDEETILDPVIEDDTATPPDDEEGDVLQPVIEDDVATNARATSDPLGLPVIDGSGPEYVEGFQVGQDILHVSVGSETDDGQTDVEVRPSNNGQDGLVYVDGKLVAVIEDAPDASVQDVIIEVDSGNR